MKKDGHLFIKDYESANGLNFKVDVLTLLLDLKYLCKEYYAATFYEDENSLQIQFTNGQKFKIKIEEL